MVQHTQLGLWALALLTLGCCCSLFHSAVANQFLDVSDSRGALRFRYEKQRNTVSIPNLIEDKDKKVHVYFNFTLGNVQIKSHQQKEDTTDVWLLALNDETDFEVTVNTDNELEQYYFVWKSPKEELSGREVCFQLGAEGKDFWYNSFQQKNQQWPMNTKAEFAEYPLNSIQTDANSEFLHVIEHFFLGTKGYAIMLDREAPLWYRIAPNGGSPLLCIKAQWRAPYRATKDVDTRVEAEIKFHIFASGNIKKVYDLVANKREGGIPKPSHIQEDVRFNSPIWSIIPKLSKYFKDDSDLHQDRIEKYLETLVNSRYPHGVISLDSWWMTESPYLGFVTSIFTDPEGMAKKIHAKDYLLELSIRPFVSKLSSDFIDPANADLWVKQHDTTGGLQPWTVNKAGLAETNHALIDFTSNKARHWFKNKLTALQRRFHVNSFSLDPITAFDGGVERFEFHDRLTRQAPVGLAHNYLDNLRNFDETNLNLTIREGHSNQALSAFIRMAPRPSTWEGLKSVIRTALALSLGGYSFILPEVVGGSTALGGTVPEELYIRWVQAVTFMPAMHFAMPPWEIDTNNKTNDITRQYVDLHAKHQRHFVDAARKRVTDGTPIIRPVWYEDPTDALLYDVNDQFMAGEGIMVAPILEDGFGDEVERTVIFPKGVWLDVDGNSYEGGERKVKAKLDQLPWFRRKQN